MRKLPNTVTILGRKYKIKELDFDKIEEFAGSPCEACVDIKNFKIYIVKDLSTYEKTIALFHEIQHISHYICGLSQVVSPELQEILCESTAQAFADLIRSMHGK